MQFPENITRLCGLKRFSFGCHPKIACFNECCRELDLALTPYDVLRLRQELKIKSADFIERYVVLELDENDIFPVLYLGMVDDGRASCPFITGKGCRVYNGRPGACRAYPVGRGAALDGNGKRQELYVLVREDHCMGFTEPETHTVAEWFESQDIEEYNRVNDEFLTLLQHEQVRQGIRLSWKQIDNFLLALYKLDDFHEFVSSAVFQESFMLTAEERAAVLADDISLLRFGIRWLKETLFAEKNG